MIKCKVSVVSDIDKFDKKDLLIISCEKQIVYEDEVDNSVTNTRTEKQIEKQIVDEEVNEDSASNTQNDKEIVDEDSIINTQEEQQSADEEVNENSVTNTQNENEDECCEDETVNLDWINEFPPLVSRGAQVCSAKSMVEKGISPSSWVSALKSNKPHCPFGVKVNGDKLEKSVVSFERSFNKANLSNAAVDRVEKFMKGRNKNDKFRQGYVKSNAKSPLQRFGKFDGRSLGVSEKSVMLPHVQEKLVVKEANEMHEADFKHEINKDETRKVEETESKEEKLELMEAKEAEKREKRRHKRLRLKERKKAAALARNGYLLDQIPNLKQENATSLEREDERQQSKSLEQDNELKEVQNMLETDNAVMRILQQEDEKTKEYEGKGKAIDDDADDRAKKRGKNLTWKARKKAKVARNKKMKWIFAITFILFIIICLTMFYIF